MTTVTPAEATTTSSAESLPLGGRSDDGAAAARVADLFEEHGSTVLGLCRVLLRNTHEAEDAVQQTFLAAYRSLLGGTEPEYPAAWLATIARNECWAHIQRRMREPLPDDGLELHLPDPVASAADRVDLAELWRAIGELPREQRRAFLLREFSGLSYDELTVALGVSEPAVESLLFRARRELRVRLRPVYGSTAVVMQLVGLRNQLARLVHGLPSQAGGAGLASGPIVAKLAAGAAAVVVGGGTVAAVEELPRHHDFGVAPAAAATIPAHVRAGDVAPPIMVTGARPAAVRGHRPAAKPVAKVAPVRSAVVAAAPIAPAASGSGASAPAVVAATPPAASPPPPPVSTDTAPVVAGGSPAPAGGAGDQSSASSGNDAVDDGGNQGAGGGSDNNDDQSGDGGGSGGSGGGDDNGDHSDSSGDDGQSGGSGQDDSGGGGGDHGGDSGGDHGGDGDGGGGSGDGG